MDSKKGKKKCWEEGINKTMSVEQSKYNWNIFVLNT